ncbi:unnamed protein product [Amoebophrya sp. A25]|nr:unnamed protein product [Amoebophrya sp. A25]|eukprot:GSA25T00020153001.1
MASEDAVAVSDKDKARGVVDGTSESSRRPTGVPLRQPGGIVMFNAHGNEDCGVSAIANAMQLFEEGDLSSCNLVDFKNGFRLMDGESGRAALQPQVLNDVSTAKSTDGLVPMDDAKTATVGAPQLPATLLPYRGPPFLGLLTEAVATKHPLLLLSEKIDKLDWAADRPSVMLISDRCRIPYEAMAFDQYYNKDSGGTARREQTSTTGSCSGSDRTRINNTALVLVKTHSFATGDSNAEERLAESRSALQDLDLNPALLCGPESLVVAVVVDSTSQRPELLRVVKHSTLKSADSREALVASKADFLSKDEAEVSGAGKITEFLKSLGQWIRAERPVNNQTPATSALLRTRKEIVGAAMEQIFRVLTLTEGTDSGDGDDVLQMATSSEEQKIAALMEVPPKALYSGSILKKVQDQELTVSLLSENLLDYGTSLGDKVVIGVRKQILRELRQNFPRTLRTMLAADDEKTPLAPVQPPVGGSAPAIGGDQQVALHDETVILAKARARRRAKIFETCVAFSLERNLFPLLSKLGSSLAWQASEEEVEEVRCALRDEAWCADFVTAWLLEILSDEVLELTSRLKDVKVPVTDLETKNGVFLPGSAPSGSSTSPCPLKPGSPWAGVRDGSSEEEPPAVGSGDFMMKSAWELEDQGAETKYLTWAAAKSDNDRSLILKKLWQRGETAKMQMLGDYKTGRNKLARAVNHFMRVLDFGSKRRKNVTYGVLMELASKEKRGARRQAKLDKAKSNEEALSKMSTDAFLSYYADEDVCKHVLNGVSPLLEDTQQLEKYMQAMAMKKTFLIDSVRLMTSAPGLKPKDGPVTGDGVRIPNAQLIPWTSRDGYGSSVVKGSRLQVVAALDYEVPSLPSTKTTALDEAGMEVVEHESASAAQLREFQRPLLTADDRTLTLSSDIFSEVLDIDLSRKGIQLNDEITAAVPGSATATTGCPLPCVVYKPTMGAAPMVPIPIFTRFCEDEKYQKQNSYIAWDVECVQEDVHLWRLAFLQVCQKSAALRRMTFFPGEAHRSAEKIEKARFWEWFLLKVLLDMAESLASRRVFKKKEDAEQTDLGSKVDKALTLLEDRDTASKMKDDAVAPAGSSGESAATSGLSMLGKKNDKKSPSSSSTSNIEALVVAASASSFHKLSKKERKAAKKQASALSNDFQVVMEEAGLSASLKDLAERRQKFSIRPKSAEAQDSLPSMMRSLCLTACGVLASGENPLGCAWSVFKNLKSSRPDVPHDPRDWYALRKLAHVMPATGMDFGGFFYSLRWLLIRFLHQWAAPYLAQLWKAKDTEMRDFQRKMQTDRKKDKPDKKNVWEKEVIPRAAFSGVEIIKSKVSDSADSNQEVTTSVKDEGDSAQPEHEQDDVIMSSEQGESATATAENPEMKDASVAAAVAGEKESTSATALQKQVADVFYKYKRDRLCSKCWGLLPATHFSKRQLSRGNALAAEDVVTASVQGGKGEAEDTKRYNKYEKAPKKRYVAAAPEVASLEDEEAFQERYLKKTGKSLPAVLENQSPSMLARDDRVLTVRAAILDLRQKRVCLACMSGVKCLISDKDLVENGSAKRSLKKAELSTGSHEPNPLIGNGAGSGSSSTYEYAPASRTAARNADHLLDKGLLDNVAQQTIGPQAPIPFVDTFATTGAGLKSLPAVMSTAFPVPRRFTQDYMLILAQESTKKRLDSMAAYRAERRAKKDRKRSAVQRKQDEIVRKRARADKEAASAGTKPGAGKTLFQKTFVRHRLLPAVVPTDIIERFRKLSIERGLVPVRTEAVEDGEKSPKHSEDKDVEAQGVKRRRLSAEPVQLSQNGNNNDSIEVVAANVPVDGASYTHVATSSSSAAVPSTATSAANVFADDFSFLHALVLLPDQTHRISDNATMLSAQDQGVLHAVDSGTAAAMLNRYYRGPQYFQELLELFSLAGLGSSHEAVLGIVRMLLLLGRSVKDPATREKTLLKILSTSKDGKWLLTGV